MADITLNLDRLHARRLLLPQETGVTLALIGCGGTGSWLAPSVVRVARLLAEKFNKDVDVVFIDPDLVEEKNCYRQNFCQAEVGRGKAQMLAFRYGIAWGVPVRAVAEAFDDAQLLGQRQSLHGRLVVLIGAVDNPGARRDIARAAGAGRCWWLDCGNHQAAGQVLLGRGGQRPDDPYQLPGLCSWLPLPSVQHPELLDGVPQDAPAAENLSCADLAMTDSQGLAINQTLAALAGDYLVRLLLTQDLDKMATYVDLVSGSMRSVYIGAGQ